jgi:hypothetical protein
MNLRWTSVGSNGMHPTLVIESSRLAASSTLMVSSKRRTRRGEHAPCDPFGSKFLSKTGTNVRSWNTRPPEVEPSIWWKFTPTERREYWEDKRKKDNIDAEADGVKLTEDGVGSSSSSTPPPPPAPPPSPFPPPDSPPQVHADSGMAANGDPDPDGLRWANSMAKVHG